MELRPSSAGTRSAAEIAAVLGAAGFNAVWKD